MSNTQQEIATPKACKQRKRAILLGVFALIFVSLAVVGCILLRDNSVAIMLIVIALAIALAVIAILATNGNRKAAKIILDVLTGGIAAIIIRQLYVTMQPSKEVETYIYMAVTAVMAILLICLNIIKQYDSPSDTKRTTRYLTYTATFVALSVIFKMLGNTVSSIVIIPNMRLSFVYIPWVISGIVLGPMGGIITALVSDILGQLTVAVGGTINPLTTLSNALFPLAPALIFKFTERAVYEVKSKNETMLVNKPPILKSDWLKVLIGMIISLVVCTMGIGSYALYTYWGYDSSMSFWAYIIAFRTPQIIIIAVNYFLCILLLPVIKKMRLTEKLKQSE